MGGLGVSHTPGRNLNWTQITQLWTGLANDKGWCTSHTSVGIQYPSGSDLLITCEGRIMTARVRRDLWEVASGPLR
jgi:hypothetical protein